MADAWDAYFSSVSQFLVDSERQYGVCNDQYTHFVLEQLEFIEVTCSVLMRSLSHASLLSFILRCHNCLLVCSFLRLCWRNTQTIVLDSYEGTVSVYILACQDAQDLM